MSAAGAAVAPPAPIADSNLSVRSIITRKPMHFLHLPVLREYIDIEFSRLTPLLPFPYNLERVIDDFVFMCFFVGNDFLPHLPSMDIREGAIDLLMAFYKQMLPAMGDYMTRHGDVNLSRVDILLSRVGAVEDEIFMRRRGREEREKREQAERKLHASNRASSAAAAPRDGGSAPAIVSETHKARMALNDSVARMKAEKASVVEAARAVPDDSVLHTGKRTRDVAAAPAPPLLPAPTLQSNRSAAAALRAQLMGFGLTVKSSAPGVDHDTVHSDATVQALSVEAALPAVPVESSDAVHVEDDGRVAKKARLDDDAPAPPVAMDGGDDPAVPPPAEDDLDLDDIFDAPLNDDEIAAVVSTMDTTGGPAMELLPSAAAVVETPSASPPPDVIALDADAEADGHGLLEAEVSSAVHSMLKGAVVDALLVRRTHEEVRDTIQLGKAGWKERYYEAKFPEESKNPDFRRTICRAYTEGLVWVFKYYYQGVASWKWYFPYHYAPFASDLRNLDAFDPIVFELGTPFRPLEQLMGVLPPRSAHALPPACRQLMMDAASPMHAFYPEKFKLDPNGKVMAWQWVVLLPFIDEKLLVDSIASVAGTFTDAERRRNQWGCAVLFTSTHSPLAAKLAPLLDDADTSDGTAGGGLVTLTPADAGADRKGISGRAARIEAAGGADRGLYTIRPGQPFSLPQFPSLAEINSVASIMVALLPPPRRSHSCDLLPGLVYPRRILSPGEDDASNRIPRLTRGFSIADLAHAVNTHSARNGGQPMPPGFHPGRGPLMPPPGSFMQMPPQAPPGYAPAPLLALHAAARAQAHAAYPHGTPGMHAPRPYNDAYHYAPAAAQALTPAQAALSASLGRAPPAAAPPAPRFSFNRSGATTVAPPPSAYAAPAQGLQGIIPGWYSAPRPRGGMPPAPPAFGGVPYGVPPPPPPGAYTAYGAPAPGMGMHGMPYAPPPPPHMQPPMQYGARHVGRPRGPF